MDVVEHWRAVPGYEDSYEISSAGRLRSRDRVRPCRGGTREVKGQLIAGAPDPGGYIKAALWKAGRAKTFLVHQLVLRAFVGEPTAGQEVRHLDGNPANNRADNLAWGTRKENMADQYAHGTRVQGSRHPKAKITPEMVHAITRSAATGVSLARKFGLGTATVCRIRKGKSTATLLGTSPSA